MSPFLSTAVSAALMGVAFALLRTARPGPALRIIFGIVTWLSVTFYTLYWVADRLSGNGIDDATWYHLLYGLEGAGFGDFTDVIAAGSVALVLGTAGCVLMAIAGRTRQRGRTLLGWLACLAAVSSILPNPALRDIAGHLWPAAPETASFRRLYRKPHATPSSATRPNLVFIYAEGMERTYLDEALFPGLTPGLRGLEAEATSFTDVRQVGMTGYTIAGIVASQCGIPLSPHQFEGNRMASMDRYLPGAGALGDLLNQQGYHLVYMGGAPLWFAGKGTFFRTHGFHEVLGREELMPQVEDSSYRSAWGLYDDSLLELTYSRFVALSREKRPFGLFLLTLDTHPPDGHRSRSSAEVIYEDGTNSMLNAVKASDMLITRFVRRIRESADADNTVVVVASDHLALPNTATSRLEKGTRRNLFLVLEPGKRTGTRIDRRGSTLDIGTTLLPFLGLQGAIGLGRDLRDPAVPLAETEEIADAVNRGVWRDEIARFWEFPVLRRTLTIDTESSSATIDDRKFWIPLLMRVTPDTQTRFEFSWDLKGADKAIVASVQKMPEDTTFILIDRCENVGALGQNLGGEGWCLITGRGRTIHTAMRLEARASFSREEIHAMMGGWPK